MKRYSNISTILFIFFLILGCSEPEEVPDLSERFNLYVQNETPIHVGGEPFSGIAYTEYSNGFIEFEMSFRKGIPHGPFEDYYENGQLSEKGTFKDGKLNGSYEGYFSNGQLKQKATYKDGKLNGSYEEYLANGQLFKKGVYKDGEPNGLKEEYYRNGQLNKKRTYKDGELNGLKEEYYENGQLMRKGTMKNGEWDGFYEAYFENGNLGMKGTMKDGGQVDLWEYYYLNGQLRGEGVYKEGIREDDWDYYYENGQMVEVSEGEVFNPSTVRIWMDRNLGAKRVAKSTDDSESYGNYYSYEEAQTACPNGYRLPTEDEWNTELNSWDSRDVEGAFNSVLKLPAAGIHERGAFKDVGSDGYYWSEKVRRSFKRLYFGNRYFGNMALVNNGLSTNKNSVRCIKN